MRHTTAVKRFEKDHETTFSDEDVTQRDDMTVQDEHDGVTIVPTTPTSRPCSNRLSRPAKLPEKFKDFVVIFRVLIV